MSVKTNQQTNPLFQCSQRYLKPRLCLEIVALLSQTSDTRPTSKPDEVLKHIPLRCYRRYGIESRALGFVNRRFLDISIPIVNEHYVLKNIVKIIRIFDDLSRPQKQKILIFFIDSR